MKIKIPNLGSIELNQFVYFIAKGEVFILKPDRTFLTDKRGNNAILPKKDYIHILSSQIEQVLTPAGNIINVKPF